MNDLSCHVMSEGPFHVDWFSFMWFHFFSLSHCSEEQEEEVVPPPADSAFLIRPRPRPTAQPESGIKRLYVSDDGQW